MSGWDLKFCISFILYWSIVGYQSCVTLKSQQIDLVIYIYICIWASPVAQLVKNLPAMLQTWVQSVGCEDPLEKERESLSLPLPLQYSGLENSMDCIVRGVTKSRT